MKKTQTKKNILSGVMSICACCAIALPASVNPAEAAGLSPIQEHLIRNEAGTNYSHESDMMHYEKRKKDASNDYEYYKKIKDSRENPGTSGAVQNYPQQLTPASMQAGVEEIDTKGVFVNSVQVAPSEILSQQEVNTIVGKLVGKNVFIGDIQAAIDDINNLYAQKGYVTARAYLPEQTVKSGNIFIELMESKVGNISIENNKWTRSNYVFKRMPHDQGEVFDIVELEKDILDFNRYNEGVNLTATLQAGTQPGTTDIKLKANENFPFHMVGVMDNAGRYTTGHLRGGAMLYADSLFGNRDRLSLGTYFSGGSTSPFADYNTPINKKDGRIGFMYSSTLAKIAYGPLTDLDIRSRAHQYSLYYSQPLVRKPGLELKSFLALNYKVANTSSDIGIIDDFIRSRDQVTSADLALQLRKDTKYGIWYLNQGVSYAAPIFDSISNYVKISGGAVRLHDFSHGVIGQIRSNYQVIPGDKRIPYLDQMQTGGLATVRGYSEGLMIGKNGYYTSGELMFPLLPREITSPRTGEKVPFIGKYVKGALFADHAGIFPSAREDIYGGSYFLMSLGMGLRVQLPGDLSARLYWGYPLVNNAWEADRKYGRFHFELTLSPDVDSLLRGRGKEVVAAPPAQKEVQADILPPAENYDDVRHYDYFRDGGGGSL